MLIFDYQFLFHNVKPSILKIIKAVQIQVFIMEAVLTHIFTMEAIPTYTLIMEAVQMCFLTLGTVRYFEALTNKTKCYFSNF